MALVVTSTDNVVAMAVDRIAFMVIPFYDGQGEWSTTPPAPTTFRQAAFSTS
jgi:hypothetical protein